MQRLLLEQNKSGVIFLFIHTLLRFFHCNYLQVQSKELEYHKKGQITQKCQTSKVKVFIHQEVNICLGSLCMNFSLRVV